MSPHDPRCAALNPATPTWCDCTALARMDMHTAIGNHELAAERVAIALEHNMVFDAPDCRDAEQCACSLGHPLEAGCDACAESGWPCDYVMLVTRAALNGYTP